MVEKLANVDQSKEKMEKKTTQRGIKALWEIRQFQSNANLLIRRLPFQRVVQVIAQSIRVGLHIQSTATMALQEAEEAF